MSFLDEHQVPYMQGGNHRHVRHGWIGYQCPWCGTSSWHLGTRLTDGYTTCWRCGPHRVGDVLIELTKQPWAVVKPIVEQFGGRFQAKQAPLGAKLKLPMGIGGLLPCHKEYLRNRGFNPDYLRDTWGVGGIGGVSTLPWRLFIPIYIRKDMVSWTTRAIGGDGLRYVSAKPVEESVPIKNTLYGQHLVPGHTVVVVEGPADAWAIGPGAVAVYGLNVSERQIAEIQSYSTRIVCFDNTTDAQKRAKKLCDKLKAVTSHGSVTYQVLLESGSDPGSASTDEITELRERFVL